MSKWTHQAALKLFQDLIRAPSPNPPGDITAVADVLSAILTDEGIDFETRTSKTGVTNLVALLEGSEGTNGPKFLFNGHLGRVTSSRIRARCSKYGWMSLTVSTMKGTVRSSS